ncbi:MAG: acylphosphatase [Chitinispirillaceae bacterium]|nr:acylphosphatase [Chitinispirillaceae bacterium]
MTREHLKRIHACVTGRVQGVGFRYYARDMAFKARLTGWVWNMFDGGVELEAQGPEEHVASFLRDIRTGPPLSHVSDVQVNELPVKEDEKGFEIRY